MENFLLTDGKNLPVDRQENTTKLLKRKKTFLAELQNTWNELTESVNQITKTS